jgi:putative membrane protein insertion efficiency factor
MATLNRLLSHALSSLISLYQYWLSPWVGSSCRFHPSCSVYAKDALKTHGALLGLFYLCRRLLCCHPLHSGGFDPVPLKK